jgi:hypothetical protein
MSQCVKRFKPLNRVVNRDEFRRAGNERRMARNGFDGIDAIVNPTDRFQDPGDVTSGGENGLFVHKVAQKEVAITSRAPTKCRAIA